MLDSTKIEQSTYLKQILDNSPDGMFTISTELEIKYVNPAFCKLLGFESDEIIGTPITQYLGDLNILNVCMAEVANCGKCNDQETIFKRKDGSVVHISKNVQAIYDNNGGFKEILVSVRDLTDLHRLNKDLEDSKQKLEINNSNLEHMLNDLRTAQNQLIESEKLASLGSLVAGIAHEINTPLGISITSATSMHEELKFLHDKFTSNSLKRTELEHFLGQASQACNILHSNLYRASDLIRSFKQVAVDQTIDELRSINLKEYISEVLTSIGPSFKNTKITIIHTCDENIELVTHPGAIYQILSNLILNSLTHAYDKDSTGKISIDSKCVGDDVIITYQDDGKGISNNNIKHIFEPFFTTRRGQGGSGLGLNIVYNLITGSLKGTIIAESNEGKGTSFTIKFPRH